MGNRFRGGIQPGAMPPLHRYVGNPVLSFVGRAVLQVTDRDFHCGLRGFDRRGRARARTAMRRHGVRERDGRQGFAERSRIVEVPTALAPDGRDRAPHLRSWRDGWRHLRFLLLFSRAGCFFTRVSYSH